jgi:hypothetical protein
MSTETKTTATGGIGFGGLLTVLFIGLKLTGYITWSWLWVLSPLWIPLALIGVFLLIMLIFLGIMTLVKARR